MSEKSPSDVVREVIALMRKERWSEIPAWIEKEALLRIWEGRIEQARAQEKAPNRLTVEGYRGHQPEMPIEVAQWHVDQSNQRWAEPSFQDVAGIESLEQLERLTPEELMARMVQAGDSRYQMQSAVIRQSPEIAELGFDPPPDEREVVGEVIDGDRAYVVYLTRYSMSGRSEPAIAVLRRSADAWRLEPDGQLFHGSGFSLFEVESDQSFRPLLPAVSQIEWVKRRFDHQLTPNHFPAVLDRFRAGPARLEHLGWIPKKVRLAKPEGRWSMHEHLGHLIDLEELGEQRLADYIARAPVLSAADMSNQKTHQADHNGAEWWELLQRFQIARESLCQELEALPPDVIAHTAQHPRLKRPMNVPEWVFFMCEHDDHHLHRIRELSIVLSLPPQSLTWS